MERYLVANESLSHAGLGHTRHTFFMQRALALAARGEGYTSPNPAVGAVVVKEGKIVGEGYHRQAGEDHAEIEALRSAGAAAGGATLYVTLEPCDHFGRTPPCTNAILAAGVETVVYAVEDPNPLVAGKGHRRLAQAGLNVLTGVCREPARYLNRFFFHYITTGQPYVVAKFAASMDGKIATRNGDSQWITGPQARQYGHYLRHICDAILVGAGTAMADDPRLTARLENNSHPCHPLRVLLDSRGRVPLQARMLRPDTPGSTLVATTAAMPDVHRLALERKGVEVLVLPAGRDGRVELPALLEALGHRQLLSLLVEGGGEVLGAFFSTGLVQEVWAFLAPLIIGGEASPGPVRGLGPATLEQAIRVREASLDRVGEDFLVRGFLQPEAAATQVSLDDRQNR